MISYDTWGKIRPNEDGLDICVIAEGPDEAGGGAGVAARRRIVVISVAGGGGGARGGAVESSLDSKDRIIVEIVSQIGLSWQCLI